MISCRFSGAQLLPGVVRLLEYFRSHRIPMILATGTDRENIRLKLRGNEFVLDFFQSLVGGDEVKEGKPHPEIFLLAAERMQMSPSECLVFEDAPVGAKVGTLFDRIRTTMRFFLGSTTSRNACGVGAIEP